MQQQIVSKGSRAVVTTEQVGRFAALLYVNSRDSIANSSATLVARTVKSAAGAGHWAVKLVAA